MITRRSIQNVFSLSFPFSLNFFFAFFKFLCVVLYLFQKNDRKKLFSSDIALRNIYLRSQHTLNVVIEGYIHINFMEFFGSYC